MMKKRFNKRNHFKNLSIMGMAFVVLMVVFTISTMLSATYDAVSMSHEDEVNTKEYKPGIDSTIIIPKLELPEEEKVVEIAKEPEKEIVVEEPQKVEVHEVQLASRSAGVRTSNGTTNSSLTYTESEIKDMIKQVAAEIGLDWRVLDSLVRVESTYQPNVTSSTGRHHGLTQVSRQNYDNLTSTLGLVPSNGSNYFDPYSNLKCGAYILQCSLIETQDYHQALVWYNMGRGAATKKGITSSSYSRKVMNYAENLGFTYP